MLPLEREALMPILMVKEEARKLVDRLPETATWEDLIHEIYVRETIERGLADCQAGRVTEVKEVRAKYGLHE
jgi:predicted transcriptional regulator